MLKETLSKAGAPLWSFKHHSCGSFSRCYWEEPPISGEAGSGAISSELPAQMCVLSESSDLAGGFWQACHNASALLR